MSRQRQSQLLQVRELACAREQELAREVSELTRRQHSEASTLAQLDGYLEEYSSSARQGARRVHEVNNERRFVDRLGKAVRAQRIQVERATESARQATHRWNLARAEVEALDRLIESRERQLQLDLQRREQREADAHNALRRNNTSEVFQ